MPGDVLSTVFLDAEFASLDQATRIRFPVQGANAKGGHDFAKHVAYRREGADYEWTGLRDNAGTLTVPLLDVPRLNARYGKMVPDLRQNLLEALQANPIGRLTHPFKGVFLAAMLDWDERMDPEQRGGTILEIQWAKHDPAVGDFIAESRLPAVAQDPPTAATAADAAVAALPGGTPAGYTPMNRTVTAALAALGPTPAVAAVITTFRDLFAAVATNQALPAVLAVAGAPANLALERVRATLYLARADLLPGLADARTYVVPRTMPLWQVAADVYGSAALTGLLFAANAVRDPAAVPAGTRLTILPLGG